MRVAGGDELDAGLLLGVLFDYSLGAKGRLETTVEAIRRELSFDQFVYRYSGEDDLPGKEGAFLACSLWMVEAIARVGRGDEAVKLIDGLIPLANDRGIYAEEVDPTTRAFLGNLPQALAHLGLISAALTLEQGVIE